MKIVTRSSKVDRCILDNLESVRHLGIFCILQILLLFAYSILHASFWLSQYVRTANVVGGLECSTCV